MIEAATLRALGQHSLEQLLQRRPESIGEPVPQSLTELGQRLSTPWSVVTALRRLDRPTLQVAEALAALGGTAAKADLARLLGNPKSEHFDLALSTLHDHAMLALQPQLTLIEAAIHAWPRPLGLGPPAVQALGRRHLQELKRIAGTLGVKAVARRGELIETLVTAFRDRGLVRELVEHAPKPIRDELVQAAGSGVPIEVRSFMWYGSSRRSDQNMADIWGLERGLLAPSPDDDGLMLVAEVALALRGEDYAAPFDPEPPEVPTAPVSQAAADNSGVAAIAAFGNTVSAILDAAGRQPLAVLKNGGVGTREMKRLAKQAGVGELEVRLALTLGFALGLWEVTGGGIAPTDAYDEWLAAEPAHRLADLMRAVWRLPQVPLGEEGTWNPLEIDQVSGLRQRIIEAIPQDRAVTDASALADAVAWRYPYSVGDPDVARHFIGAAWREAELTGIVAAGAVTAAGKALLNGGDGLAEALTQVGAAQKTARFGADLTAVVTGTPAAGLTALLDLTADRESRSTASTWRFSPASVRRAMDAGHGADALLARLAEVASNGLPQPLEYLLRDVARQHGSIRARAVASCLRSDDEALLSRLAADRKLASLGLRLLAPTVLASAQPVEQTLAALRSAGYAPVAEDAEGVTIVQEDKTQRATTSKNASFAPPRRKIPKQASTHEIAKKLLAAPDVAKHGASPTLRGIEHYAPDLGQAERRLLAYAIDTEQPVTISYVNRQGNESQRVIEQIQLIGDELAAWCRLRDGERFFNLGRILAVWPAN